MGQHTCKGGGVFTGAPHDPLECWPTYVAVARMTPKLIFPRKGEAASSQEAVSSLQFGSLPTKKPPVWETSLSRKRGLCIAPCNPHSL